MWLACQQTFTIMALITAEDRAPGILRKNLKSFLKRLNMSHSLE